MHYLREVFYIDCPTSENHAGINTRQQPSFNEAMETVKQCRLPEVFRERIEVERRNRPMLFCQGDITHEHQSTFGRKLLIVNCCLTAFQIRFQGSLYLSRFLEYNCLNLIKYSKVMTYGSFCVVE